MREISELLTREAGPFLPGRPAIVASDAKPNLPIPFASFIGRERELETLTGLIGDHRLVTLVGAPGVGKTRMAIRLANSVASHYADGAWMVELAGLFEPTLVATATAQSLAVSEHGRTSLEALRQDLRDRELLVVLDNCEHLLTAAASMVETLLIACPDLHLLATSRQPFGLIGEVVWQVPPMSLPELHAAERPVSQSGDSPALGALLASEAGRLFADRARAARSTYSPSESDAPAVTEICSRVDGIPLAIELAAARIAHLSPQQIAARLDDRFRLLITSSPAAMERHRTLRALVDWSHDLLADDEQALFRRLGVFAGGWTLEAAEAVCGDDVPAVLGLLSQLVDKSLVQVDEQRGLMRYRMQDSLRQYAIERLEESGEIEAIRRRHCEFYALMAEEAESRLFSADQELVLSQLEGEHDDLRLALGWSSESGDAEIGMRLAGALWRFWQVRGYLREGRTWLDRLLAAGASHQTVGRARALNATGFLTFLQGDYEAASPLLEEGLAIRRALSDDLGIVESLTNLGLLLRCLDDPVQARQHFEEALQVSRICGDRAWEGRVLNKLARLVFYEGDMDSACDLHEQSLTIGRETGNTWDVAMALGDLADARFTMGQNDAAFELYAESLGLWQELGDERGVAQGLEGFAILTAARGQHERAVSQISAARSIRQRISEPNSPSRKASLDSLLEQARSDLGETAYAAAWALGDDTSVDQAIHDALQNPSLPTSDRAAPSSVEPSIVPAADALTARELEIATLIARGMTNKQIAEALVVSQRTVEWHVANLIGKLAFRSRSQIAAWAASQGLS